MWQTHGTRPRVRRRCANGKHKAREGRTLAQAISLCEGFERVPEHRCAAGRCHPLPAVLTLATVAMLSGARGLNAIAWFGRGRGTALARASPFSECSARAMLRT